MFYQSQPQNPLLIHNSRSGWGTKTQQLKTYAAPLFVSVLSISFHFPAFIFPSSPPFPLLDKKFDPPSATKRNEPTNQPHTTPTKTSCTATWASKSGRRPRQIYGRQAPRIDHHHGTYVDIYIYEYTYIICVCCVCLCVSSAPLPHTHIPPHPIPPSKSPSNQPQQLTPPPTHITWPPAVSMSPGSPMSSTWTCRPSGSSTCTGRAAWVGALVNIYTGVCVYYAYIRVWVGGENPVGGYDFSPFHP